MKVSIENFDKKIDFIKVDNEAGLVAEFSNFGAGLYSLHFNEMPMILEIENKKDWLYSKDYYGKSVGRVCGRIPCHGYLNNREYNLKETMANYCLHGGDLTSVSFKKWKYKIKEFKNKINVIFSIVSKDGENGFTGKCNMKVIYEMYTEKNDLKIIFKGNTDSTTYLNMTNHAYYNLNNSANLDESYLKVNAHEYGAIDDTVFIQKRDIIPDILNFERFTKLKSRLDVIEKKVNVHTIDHTYLLNEVKKNKPQLILKNKDASITFYTTYPAINIYCDDVGKEYKFKQFEETNSMRRALAIEPQLFDKDINTLILNKGEKFNHFMVLKFKDLR